MLRSISLQNELSITHTRAEVPRHGSYHPDSCMGHMKHGHRIPYSCVLWPPAAALKPDSCHFRLARFWSHSPSFFEDRLCGPRTDISLEGASTMQVASNPVCSSSHSLRYMEGPRSSRAGHQLLQPPSLGLQRIVG